MTPRPPSSPLFPSTPFSRSGPAVPRVVVRPDHYPLAGEIGARDLGRDVEFLPVGIGEPVLHVELELDRNARSEEHTSELQSQSNLVCRLLLEKKKTNNITLS